MTYKLNPELWEAEQPAHCCADGQGDNVRIEVRAHDGGGGRYIAVSIDGEWAFDNAEEIDALAAQLRAIIKQVQEGNER